MKKSEAPASRLPFRNPRKQKGRDRIREAERTKSLRPDEPDGAGVGKRPTTNDVFTSTPPVLSSRDTNHWPAAGSRLPGSAGTRRNVSFAATRLTGASRCVEEFVGNAGRDFGAVSPAQRIFVAPPARGWSSATEAAIVSQSNGFSVRRSISSTLTPCSRSSLCAACSARGTTAP